MRKFDLLDYYEVLSSPRTHNYYNFYNFRLHKVLMYIIVTKADFVITHCTTSNAIDLNYNCFGPAQQHSQSHHIEVFNTGAE